MAGEDLSEGRMHASCTTFSGTNKTRLEPTRESAQRLRSVKLKIADGIRRCCRETEESGWVLLRKRHGLQLRARHTPVRSEITVAPYAHVQVKVSVTLGNSILFYRQFVSK